MDWTNPLPFVLGGGPTDVESTWRAMRAMVGGEHGPGPEEGIEDLGRQVRATAIAGAERAIERAFLQIFPGRSTDALELWDDLLLVAGAENDVALRALLVLAWLPPDGATTPSLTEDLTALSSKLSVQYEGEDDTIVTVPGKYLAPTDNIPPYGLASPAGLTSSVWPNYASRDVLRVVYTLDAGEISIPENLVREVTKLLARRLPSFITWTLVQFSEDEGPGFFLDGGLHGESLLDVTAFG